MSVRAIKAGAMEFLTKPFRDQDLLAAIENALERDRTRRREHAEMAVLRTRYATLTPREREVMALVVSGRLNKQSAAELGITETTVKVHRHHVMAKMDAGSLADLVRMWEKLGEQPAGPGVRQAHVADVTAGDSAGVRGFWASAPDSDHSPGTSRSPHPR